ncbi:unnamed protein product [Microthlaspi erraticum]|uniref:Uncharacterized protein n=1 Tax=Microthlaspi erraticum TaxID=1685480 RepID=A0A6D2JQJ8_9BRAS|nr:unnamed protein product [Microthlaspi erraticum]
MPHIAGQSLRICKIDSTPPLHTLQMSDSLKCLLFRSELVMSELRRSLFAVSYSVLRCRFFLCPPSSSLPHSSGAVSSRLKQYHRNNNNINNAIGCSDKTLNCPYCRRFMNARPRCCDMDKCVFSGTYSQCLGFVSEYSDVKVSAERI